MESLCESCALEQLWQPLSPSPTSQLALLSFLSERLTRSNATSSLHTTWTNEKNVTFLTKEFETCLQALISLESAILEEAFAAKALVESPAVLQMKIAAGFLKLLCCLSASEDTLPSLQSSTALLDVTLGEWTITSVSVHYCIHLDYTEVFHSLIFFDFFFVHSLLEGAMQARRH